MQSFFCIVLLSFYSFANAIEFNIKVDNVTVGVFDSELKSWDRLGIHEYILLSAPMVVDHMLNSLGDLESFASASITTPGAHAIGRTVISEDTEDDIAYSAAILIVQLSYQSDMTEITFTIAVQSVNGLNAVNYIMEGTFTSASQSTINQAGQTRFCVPDSTTPDWTN